MAPEIFVDMEVYRQLQTQAEPFVDTPNTVLRRLLKLKPSNVGADEAARGERHKGDGGSPQENQDAPQSGTAAARAPRGSILPLTDYWLPILEALEEAGGSAPGSKIIKAVGQHLKDRLTERDRQPLQSGSIRWRSRTQFARLRLIERGLMKQGSPARVWEISDQGREYLSEHAG